MSRLTTARVEAWDKRLAKAEAEIEKVLAEQRAHYGAAKGGRLQDLTTCVTESRDASAHVKGARVACRNLMAGERRRKG